jgi:hypothetical protein
MIFFMAVILRTKKNPATPKGAGLFVQMIVVAG